MTDAIDSPNTSRIIVPTMQDAETTELEEGGYRLEYTYKLGSVRFDRAIETSKAESDT